MDEYGSLLILYGSTELKTTSTGRPPGRRSRSLSGRAISCEITSFIVELLEARQVAILSKSASDFRDLSGRRFERGTSHQVEPSRLSSKRRTRGRTASRHSSLVRRRFTKSCSRARKAAITFLKSTGSGNKMIFGVWSWTSSARRCRTSSTRSERRCPSPTSSSSPSCSCSASSLSTPRAFFIATSSRRTSVADVAINPTRSSSSTSAWPSACSSPTVHAFLFRRTARLWGRVTKRPVRLTSASNSAHRTTWRARRTPSSPFLASTQGTSRWRCAALQNSAPGTRSSFRLSSTSAAARLTS
mmetsp:Transcript_19502/g.62659  ORF Transcript_19502/g.62659 Transcript_19502/m.62659 type:complete len:301 (+) Transcript_19502:1433-2335(+)